MRETHGRAAPRALLVASRSDEHCKVKYALTALMMLRIFADMLRLMSSEAVLRRRDSKISQWRRYDARG